MNDSIQKSFSQALHLRETGKKMEAIDLLEKIAEFAEESPIVIATLGHCYWDMGRLVEAVTAFKKATELDPYSEIYSLGLFHTLWLQDKPIEALEETKRFMRLSDSEDYRKIVAGINNSGN